MKKYGLISTYYSYIQYPHGPLLEAGREIPTDFDIMMMMMMDKGKGMKPESRVVSQIYWK